MINYLPLFFCISTIGDGSFTNLIDSSDVFEFSCFPTFTYGVVMISLFAVKDRFPTLFLDFELQK